jgi:hypothetical protein
MSSACDFSYASPHAPAIGQAEVMQVDRARGRLLVRRADEDSDAGAWAQLAVSWPAELGAGDTVLVAGDATSALFVIGVLDPRPSASCRRLETASGASARVLGQGDEERLQVVSEQGQLLIDYEPARRRVRVQLMGGDVQFVAPDGSLEFAAARAIRLHSQCEIELLAPQLRACAADVELSSRNVVARTARARIAVETLESVLGTVTQKARNLFATVADLCLLRVQRMHTVTEQDAIHHAGRVVIKSEGDVKIDGQQIHLG